MISITVFPNIMQFGKKYNYFYKNTGAGILDKRDIPRLFVWGSIMENERIMKVVEDAGAKVVAEDLCNGSRSFDAQISISNDPILSIARRCIMRSPRSGMVNEIRRKELA